MFRIFPHTDTERLGFVVVADKATDALSVAQGMSERGLPRIIIMDCEDKRYELPDFELIAAKEAADAQRA